MKTSILFLMVSLGLSANVQAECIKGFDPLTGKKCDTTGVNENGDPVNNPTGNTVTQDPNNHGMYTNENPYQPTQEETKEQLRHGSVVSQEMMKENDKIDKQVADSKKNKKTTTAGSGSGCQDGGKFGGASCETTDAINMGVGVANKLYQSVGAAAVNNKGTDVQNTLQSRGIEVSNKDYLEGQAKVADSAKKSNNTAGAAQTANAGIQIWRAIAHKKSSKNVMAQCNELAADDPSRASCFAEARKQKDKAVETGVQAAITAEQAGASLMQARMAKKTAEELRKMAAQGDGTGPGTYNYTPPTMPTIEEGAPVGTTVDTGAITNNDPNGGLGLDGGVKDFNPGYGDNGAMGPQAATFKDGAAPSGGGGGSGMGSSGGTSASKGDGEGAQQAGAGKPQTGGKYETGEGGGSKFSRGGGGGAGVGMDSSFADLLKKMLPGGDEEKKEEKASLDLDQDRSPASDKAAVIGRNKNIFIEISKRYQKKNSEGAVIFQ